MKKSTSKISVKLLSLFLAIIMLLPASAIISAGEIIGGLTANTEIIEGEKEESSVTTLSDGVSSDAPTTLSDGTATTQESLGTIVLKNPIDVSAPEYYRLLKDNESFTAGRHYIIANSNSGTGKLLQSNHYTGAGTTSEIKVSDEVIINSDQNGIPIIYASAVSSDTHQKEWYALLYNEQDIYFFQDVNASYNKDSYVILNYSSSKLQTYAGSTGNNLRNPKFSNNRIQASTSSKSYYIYWDGSNFKVATNNTTGKPVYAYEKVEGSTAKVTKVFGTTGAVQMNKLVGDKFTQNITATTKTGTQIFVEYPDGSANIDVTVDMLYKADGTQLIEELKTSTLPGNYTNLTLKYQGQEIIDNYTLYVVPDLDNYTKYPAEGSVRAEKEAVTSDYDFGNTGVARVDVTATGVAKKVPMDVLVLVDVKDGNKLNEAKTALTNVINAFATPNQDGTSPDIDIAVAQFDNFTYFNGYGSGANAGNVTDGLVLDYTDVQEAAAKDDINIVSQNGVSNYDRAMHFAYETITNRKAEDSTREQVVVLISNGKPSQYNYSTGSATPSEFTHPENKHWMAEAIKGDTSKEYDVIWNTNTTFGTNYVKADNFVKKFGLGATIFTVGVDANAETLKRMANNADKYYAIDGDFANMAHSVRKAATNAVVTDTIAENFDLQTATVGDRAPTITVKTYDLYKYNEVGTEINNVTVTEAMVGGRKSNTPKATLETVTFDGNKAYSDKLGTSNNIAVDNKINAKYFTYDFATKTFTWKIGDITENEIALSYYVHIENSKDENQGVLPGTYAVGKDAKITYTNVSNTELTKDIASPTLTWKKNVVKYAFYLVNNDGKVLVDKNGVLTGAFADKIAVSSEIEVELTGGSASITTEMLQEKIEELNKLPNGYALYDNNVSCTVNANGWTITPSATAAPNNTTYVTGYGEPTNAFTPSTEGDFSNITVWFAVKDTVGVKDDVVVLDYGLPMLIDVMANDFFPGDHVLRGVMLGHHSKLRDTALNGRFVNLYDSIVGNSGHPNHDYANPTPWHVLLREQIVSGKKFTAYSYMYCDVDHKAPHNNVNADGRFCVKYTPWVMDIPEEEHYSYCVEYNIDGVDRSAVIPPEETTTYSTFYIGHITIIPATSIYFEEEFIDFYNGIDNQGKPMEWVDVDEDVAYTQIDDLDHTHNYIQDEDRPGDYNLPEVDFDNVYGSDSRYAETDCFTYSLGNAKWIEVGESTLANSARAEFTFTGTGFDLFSVTSGDTGTLSVQIETAGNAETSKYMTKNELVEGENGPVAQDKEWLAFPTYEYELFRDAEGWTYGGDGYVIPCFARSTKNYDRYKYQSVTIKDKYQVKFHIFSEDLEYLGVCYDANNKDGGWFKANGADRSFSVDYIFSNFAEASPYKDKKYGNYMEKMTPRYFRIQFCKIGAEKFAEQGYGKRPGDLTDTGYGNTTYTYYDGKWSYDNHEKYKLLEAAIAQDPEMSFELHPESLTNNLIVYLKEPGTRGETTSTNAVAYETPVVAAAAAEEMKIEYAQGTIDGGADTGDGADRIRTTSFYNVEDYSKITVKSPYQVAIHCYNNDGHLGYIDWIDGEITKEKILSKYSTAKYFRFAVKDTIDNKVAPGDITDEIIFTPFNRDTVAPSNETIAFNWSASTWINGEGVEKSDIHYVASDKISIADAHRIYLPKMDYISNKTYAYRYHFYNGDEHLGYAKVGNLVDNSGFAKNSSGSAVAIVGKIVESDVRFANATHFRISVRNDKGTAQTAVASGFKVYKVGAEVVSGNVAPAEDFAQGTIAEGGKEYGNAENRIRTTYYKITDFDGVGVSAGYKMVFHVYKQNEDGTYTWLSSNGNWQAAGSDGVVYYTASIDSFHPEATHFRLVIAKENDKEELTVEKFTDTIENGGGELYLYSDEDLDVPGEGDTAISPGNDPDAGIIVKRYVVQNYYGFNDKFEADSSVAGEDSNALYQIPVISERDLPYNTYKVTITPRYSSMFDPAYKEGSTDNKFKIFIDSVRIYNPSTSVGNNDTVKNAYLADGEYAPQYIRIRDLIFGNHKDYSELVSSTGIGKGALFIDGFAEAPFNALTQKMIDVSPKNELYLARGQAIAFHLQAEVKPANVHLGMKTVVQATTHLPKMENGTIDGLNSTAPLKNQESPERIRMTELLRLSDYTNVKLSSKYKATYQIYDKDGNWIGRHKDSYQAPGADGIVYTSSYMSNVSNLSDHQYQYGKPYYFRLVLAKSTTTEKLDVTKFTEGELSLTVANPYAKACIISYNSNGTRTQRYQDIKSGHEMYYDIGSAVEWEYDEDAKKWITTKPVVILNDSDSVLSITQLKAAFNTETTGEVSVVVRHDTIDNAQDAINEN